MGFLSLFGKNKIDVNAELNQQIKARLVKNSEVVLDALGKNIKGGSLCPFLLGAPCMGEFCMHFQKFYSQDRETGKRKEFSACAHTHQNNLTIELNQSIRELIDLQKGKTNDTNP